MSALVCGKCRIRKLCPIKFVIFEWVMNQEISVLTHGSRGEGGGNLIFYMYIYNMPVVV